MGHLNVQIRTISYSINYYFFNHDRPQFTRLYYSPNLKANVFLWSGGSEAISPCFFTPEANKKGRGMLSASLSFITILVKEQKACNKPHVRQWSTVFHECCLSQMHGDIALWSLITKEVSLMKGKSKSFIFGDQAIKLIDKYHDPHQLKIWCPMPLPASVVW